MYKIIPILFYFLFFSNIALSDDYFSRIASISDGKLTRFVRMPIKVYVDPISDDVKLKEDYIAELNYALKAWEEGSNGKISFQTVETVHEADIRIFWLKNPLSKVTDTSLGEADLIRDKEENFHVEVKMSLRERGSNLLVPKEVMRTMCLHEIGHAIGLWGHSDNKEDMMFPISEAQELTQRDKNTISQVYSKELGYPMHKETISLLLEELKLQPENARLHYQLGSVYLGQKHYPEAISSFKRSVELEPSNMKALENLAKSQMASGDHEAALQTYEALLKLTSSPELYNYLGGIYYQFGKFEKAVEKFREILKLDPRNKTALERLYSLYYDHGYKLLEAEKYHEAILSFSEAEKLDSKEAKLYNNLGIARDRLGEFQSAITDYKRALELSPNTAEIEENLAESYNNFGVKLSNEGKITEAMEMYKSALALRPDLQPVKENLVSSYERLASQLKAESKYMDAIQMYQKVLGLAPNSQISSRIYNEVGLIQIELRIYSEAVETFKGTLDIDPGYSAAKQNLAAAYHYLGMALDGQGKFQEAIDQFKLALQLDPQNTNLKLSLGLAYQHIQRWDEAAAEFESILKIDSQNAQAKSSLVNLSIEQASKNLAAKKYDLALESFSKIPEELKNAQIYDGIGYILIMRKKPLEALAQFERALTLDPADNVAYQNLKSLESQFQSQLIKNEKSQSLKDRLALVRVSLANCLMGRGELLKAKKSLKDALELRPEPKEAMDNAIKCAIRLARALMEKSLIQEAKQVIDWASELDSEHEELKKIAEDLK